MAMPDLLFLAHRIPYPPDKGDKIRAWNVFRYLARSHRMHLGCFIDDPLDRQHVAELRGYCADMLCLPINPRFQRLKSLLGLRRGQPLSLGYFHQPRMKRWVDAKLASGTIKGIYVFSSAMATYAIHASGCLSGARHGRCRFRKVRRLCEDCPLPGAGRVGARSADAVGVRASGSAVFRSQSILVRTRMAAFRSLGARGTVADKLGLERRRSRIFLTRASVRAAIRW